MPGLCMSRSATRVRAVRVSSRVRVRSPTSSQVHYKKSGSFITKSEEKSDDVSSEFSFNSYLRKDDDHHQQPSDQCGNRVMVVIDSGPEAKGALEWALSHTVQAQDTVVLLHVVKQGGKSNGEIEQRAYDLLRSTKNICQLKRPEVNVEMAIGEGKDKGPTIVEEAKRLKASLLVLGHRKQSFLRRLQIMWSSKRTWNSVVDYCIQNANCMTIAVRRKHRKYGGYLITTKRHKNFWLLA